MAWRLPRLRGTDTIIEGGKASLLFSRWWQSLITEIEAALNSLQAAIDAIVAAQAAADAAQAAADAANAAAATANSAASAAQTAADNAADVAALGSSGVTGASITATDAGSNVTVNITSHTRVYGDGISVSVNAGAVTGLSYSTTYFIYYDQASRAGGAVTYQATTSQVTAAQTGDRHLVGQVTTPAAAAPDTTGEYVGAPGIGGLYQ